jgi:hypothetical protein
MACVILTSEAGDRRVPENTPYVLLPGEQITGVDWLCDPTAEKDELERKLQEEGIPWGKVVKAMAGRLGVKQCSACKAREAILDQAKKNGWAETFRQLKETF